jgi:hypothetical protein
MMRSIIVPLELTVRLGTGAAAVVLLILLHWHFAHRQTAFSLDSLIEHLRSAIRFYAEK